MHSEYLDYIFDDLVFYTRPSDAGQIVEVSYAFDGEGSYAIRRTVDRSVYPNEIRYHFRDQDGFTDEFNPVSDDEPPLGDWFLVEP
jgi:hypothetical protein